MAALLVGGCRGGRDDQETRRAASDARGNEGEARADTAAVEQGGRGLRFVGDWATDSSRCPTGAWRFTPTALATPAGSTCRFSRVVAAPGGYDVDARCTADGAERGDRLQIRFAESAGALLLDARSIPAAGLTRCGAPGSASPDSGVARPPRK